MNYKEEDLKLLYKKKDSKPLCKEEDRNIHFFTFCFYGSAINIVIGSFILYSDSKMHILSDFDHFFSTLYLNIMLMTFLFLVVYYLRNYHNHKNKVVFKTIGNLFLLLTLIIFYFLALLIK